MPTAEQARANLEKYRYQGKLTPQLRNRACDMVRKGVTPKSALKALGVADSTIRDWYSKAEEEDSNGKHAVLCRELLSAEQECIARVSENATRLTERDGRVALDYLSRRSDEWSRTDRVDVNVQIDAGPVWKQLAENWQRLQAGEMHILEGSYELQERTEEEGSGQGEGEALQAEE